MGLGVGMLKKDIDIFQEPPWFKHLNPSVNLEIWLHLNSLLEHIRVLSSFTCYPLFNSLQGVSLFNNLAFLSAILFDQLNNRIIASISIFRPRRFNIIHLFHTLLLDRHAYLCILSHQNDQVLGAIAGEQNIRSARILLLNPNFFFSYFL